MRGRRGGKRSEGREEEGREVRGRRGGKRSEGEKRREEK